MPVPIPIETATPQQPLGTLSQPVFPTAPPPSPQAPWVLFLDYDGTLAPIVGDPAQAYLEPRHIPLLRALFTDPCYIPVVISGRAVDHLKTFLEPVWDSGFHVCGLHGGHHVVTHPAHVLQAPDEARVQDMDRWHATLSYAIAEHSWDGIHLEHKGHSLAVHTRHAVSDTEEAFTQWLEGWFAQDTDLATLLQEEFRRQSGKSVVEWVPRAFNKGEAVHRIVNHVLPEMGATPGFCIYLGDDDTDEIGMEATMACGGSAIRVLGSDVMNPQTVAPYTLASVDEVYALFQNQFGYSQVAR